MLAQDQRPQARQQRDALKGGRAQLRAIERHLLNAKQPGKQQRIGVSDRNVHQGNGEDVGVPNVAATEFFDPRQEAFVIPGRGRIDGVGH